MNVKHVLLRISLTSSYDTTVKNNYIYHEQKMTMHPQTSQPNFLHIYRKFLTNTHILCFYNSIMFYIF